MQYMKIHLSGVLQYFCNTKSTTLKGTYTTSIVPTKSSIVGLISAAFGYDRESIEIDILAKSINLKYDTVKAPKYLEDYQTIKPYRSQQRYMSYGHKQFMTLKSYEGKPKELKDSTIIKKVQYLQDCEFNVYIGGDRDLLETIYEAFKNPVYTLYFGKRSCVPNKPIVTELELIDEGDLKNVPDCV